MYSWMMNPNLEKDWNDDALIVTSCKNEQFQSHGDKLKVIVPIQRLAEMTFLEKCIRDIFFCPDTF